MPIKIGEVEALFRYPVKSMSGELLEVADLGWHGLDGDRRLAFRRADDRGGFPLSREVSTDGGSPPLWNKENQLRKLGGGQPMFARRKERSWPCSARNWRGRSVAAMVRRSR